VHIEKKNILENLSKEILSIDSSIYPFFKNTSRIGNVKKVALAGHRGSNDRGIVAAILRVNQFDSSIVMAKMWTFISDGKTIF